MKVQRLLSSAVILVGVFLCATRMEAQASITIGSGATVTVDSGSRLHISGNWTNHGTFTSGNSTVIFNGAATQTITNSSGDAFHNLTVDKNSGDLILNHNVTISNTLTLTRGDISTGANRLTLGTTSEGILSRTGGAVIGNFARYIGLSTGTRLFPVGTSANDKPVTVNYTSAPTTPGIITISHTSPPGNFAELTTPLDDAGYTLDRRSAMFWTLTASSLTGGTYDLDIDASGQVGVNNPDQLRLMYSPDGVAFSLAGTHRSGVGTIVKRANIDGNTFGQVYVGANRLDNPLGGGLGTEVKILPESQTVHVGETATITLHIENAANLGGFEFKLRYKTGVGEIPTDAIEVGSLLTNAGGEVIAANPRLSADGDDSVLFYGAAIYGDPSPPSGNGVLAVLTFTATDVGTTPLALFDVKVGDADANPQPVEITAGSLTVIPLDSLLIGDANNDGEITDADAMWVLQAVVGQRAISAADVQRCDVTGDGTCSALDAALILQYLAGIITEFPASNETTNSVP